MVKLLIVDVDSLFRVSEKRGELISENIWSVLPGVLDKIQESDWFVSLWTTRSRHQTYHIIETLRKSGVWSNLQLVSGTTLLLNTYNNLSGNHVSTAITKLSLFSKIYDPLIHTDSILPVFIESDVIEAGIIQSYTSRSIPVKLSPQIWLEMLITDVCHFDSLLLSSIHHSEPITELFSTKFVG